MKLFTFKKGFTLVEVIVSVTIFSMIMVMGMGALLNVNTSHKASQAQKDAMDTFNFALEGMTRDIRTGVNMYCDIDTDNPSNDINEHNDCITSQPTLGFLASADRGYFMYYEDNGSLFRKRILDPEGSPGVHEAPEELISSSRVVVTGLNFRVVGSQSLTEGDERQPYVLVRLTAHTVSNPDTEFLVQTLVSVRSLDAL